MLADKQQPFPQFVVTDELSCFIILEKKNQIND